ncbi:hypothetical protein SAMN05216383_101206 [Prevotella sp. KH2C16]|nr:hypothetical protein SAMN05216383_101206 [Prevotella sp. KH2C16]
MKAAPAVARRFPYHKSMPGKSLLTTDKTTGGKTQ